MKKAFYLLVSAFCVFGVMSISSCKSVGSTTSGRYADIAPDHFQYVEISKVYDGQAYSNSSKPVVQRHVIAEALNGGEYLLSFSSISNSIPITQTSLSSFRPKSVLFTAMAKPNNDGTYTVYALSGTKADENLIYTTSTGSEYEIKDYNVPVGTAVISSNTNSCERVNRGSTDLSSSPLHTCIVLENLCTSSYKDKCSLQWEKELVYRAQNYYIKDIEIK